VTPAAHNAGGDACAPYDKLFSMKLSAGDRLGNYEIINSIGRGGMGQVYKARDVQLGREGAIKVLVEEFAGDEGPLKRFLSEAKATSALNHPNILTVFGIGEENNNPYIITEFIDGITLRQMLNNGPLPVSRAFEIALQALSGLVKAHSIGIIHRDLKPDNLMITKDGFVKILDFGLAKLLKEDSGSERPLETLGHVPTESGMILGTAAYMSPEQARGQRADARTDIFSMGLILYEMISGKHPFWRATAIDTMSAILRDPVEPLSQFVPNIPPGVSEVVEKALQKDPNDRFATANEFEAALRAHRLQISTLDNLPTAFYDSKPQTEVKLPKRSHRKSLFIVEGLLLLIALGAVFFALTKKSAVRMTGPPVIAVMAIENKTTDPDLAKADIGRILSDAFVQLLYDFKGVQVVSPYRVHSVTMKLGRKFEETAKDLELAHKVCTESEANTILSGSLSQIGKTFVLNATLTTLPGEQLLGNFQAQSENKNELLETLTASIASRLKATLTAAGGKPIEEGKNVDQVATGSMEAYSHYIKGLELNNEGRFLQAAEEIRKALAIDPNMAVAWSELACVYSFAGDDAKAQEAQNKALQLRSRLSRKEQLWIDSISLWLDGNGAAYRTGIDKFINEFPDDRNGYFSIGLGWQWLDHDCKQAIGFYEKAYQLTPDYYPVTKALVDCQVELGQRQQAIASLQRYQKVVPSGHGFDQAKWRLQKLQQ
jgi:serine/threonine protein kinase